MLVQALLDHQHLHALVAALKAGRDVRATMRELGRAARSACPPRGAGALPADRACCRRSGSCSDGDARRGGGPVWGDASDDLNATLLEWSSGAGPPEHVNEERDVLVFVADGSAKVDVDGEERELCSRRSSHHPEGHAAEDHSRARGRALPVGAPPGDRRSKLAPGDSPDPQLLAEASLARRPDPEERPRLDSDRPHEDALLVRQPGAPDRLPERSCGAPPAGTASVRAAVAHLTQTIACCPFGPSGRRAA